MKKPLKDIIASPDVLAEGRVKTDHLIIVISFTHLLSEPWGFLFRENFSLAMGADGMICMIAGS